MILKDFDYSYLSYETIYSAKGNFDLQMASRPCFQYVFHRSDFSKPEHYRIFLRLGSNPLSGRNNVCIFDKNQISVFLNELMKYCDFGYSIEDGRDSKDTEGYYLNLDVKGTKIIHKFLLTCIRQLYEFPYTFILEDALGICNLQEFKTMSLLNIEMLIYSTNSLSDYEQPLNIETIHSLVPFLQKEYVELIDTDVIKAKLLDTYSCDVNKLFKRHDITRLKSDVIKNLKNITFNPNGSYEKEVRSHKDWNNPEYKALRLEAYKNNKKLLY